jgi:two-component SAPR family response regulator
MNVEDYKCKVREVECVSCDGCNELIYKCDECKGDYFQEDDFVGCVPDGRHLCKCCFEDWWNEYTNDLNEKQALKCGELE